MKAKADIMQITLLMWWETLNDMHKYYFLEMRLNMYWAAKTQIQLQAA